MVGLCKTKIWWKSKIALYGYRLFHCSIKTDDIHTDISEYVETRFDTSNYESDRPLSKGENKEVIELKMDLVEKSWRNLLDYKQKLIVT